MSKVRVGVIGGSGLYDIEGIEGVKRVTVPTPFGKPSDQFVIGKLNGVKVAFLPRHGRGHTILPSELNFRANIYGFKKLGVEFLISVSAVGSMKEEIVPGHLVIVDQFFDRTKGRIGTFFGQGIVAHLSFADPVCNVLSNVLYQAAWSCGATVHKGGTYLCMEGPQFSTRAESAVYRQWGVDVIGMTNLQEAKLAREAEICYATLALATDYDCWHESETEDVTVEMVIQQIAKNVTLAKEVIKKAMSFIPANRNCGCPRALDHAIITDKKKISEQTRKKLHLIIGKYLKNRGEVKA
ncbi:MAG: S-methyl-5'-thioadenosine phosphorylase [Elusimicrobiota bacterium]